MFYSVISWLTLFKSNFYSTFGRSPNILIRLVEWIIIIFPQFRATKDTHYWVNKWLNNDDALTRENLRGQIAEMLCANFITALIVSPALLWIATYFIVNGFYFHLWKVGLMFGLFYIFGSLHLRAHKILYVVGK
jgi:hypothetical protein